MDALPTSPAVPRIFRIAALRQEVEVEVMCTLLEVVDPKYDPTYNLPARSEANCCGTHLCRSLPNVI